MSWIRYAVQHNVCEQVVYLKKRQRGSFVAAQYLKNCEGYVKVKDTIANFTIVEPALKKLFILFRTSYEHLLVIHATAKLVVTSLSSVVEAYINFGSCFKHHGGQNSDCPGYAFQLLRKKPDVP
ncbi:hypothetical protein Pint_04863 [Pistacia integerrima]|uniref:Uncharacterized protein n=1 Tax=Pistacia integerrima TaxID=434235 RepID=A0ACC0Z274_9ROSI|nr:hypothetical protein Pint_04863 [Pistacia integerrima]